MQLNSSMIRPAIAVALVVVIAALFVWREVLPDDDGDEAGDSTALGVASQSLKVEVGEPAPDFTLEFMREAGRNGLLTGRVGLHGNVVRVAPPLVITQEEADLGIDIMDKVLGEIV